ncbi:MAG: flagellar biosynthesis repressor FlbT, partial [Thermodesulfovibrionales bacterium]|nr:flagellar biosynthesis repressor FlbT [Thermodesulfovibrionales bacterium]
KIYLLIQLMYIDEANLTKYHSIYWELVKNLVTAIPKTLLYIDSINEMIISNKYYQALKRAKKLIEYEEEVLLANAKD